MYNDIQPNHAIPNLTPAIAQEVNGYLKQYKSPTVAFETTGKYFIEYYVDVESEIDALEQVAKEAMMRVRRTYKEQTGLNKAGEPIMTTVTIEPSPATKDELINEVSSDLLDTTIFIDDFIDYIFIYKENTTREEFVEQFIFLKTNDGV